VGRGAGKALECHSLEQGQLLQDELHALGPYRKASEEEVHKDSRASYPEVDHDSLHDDSLPLEVLDGFGDHHQTLPALTGSCSAPLVNWSP